MDEEDAELPINRESGGDANRSNGHSVTILLSKAVIGAGVAALPLTNVGLGWPLATALLLLVAVLTKISLDLITRAGDRCCSTSYVETTKTTLNQGWAVLLDIAIVLFSLGLMLVYSVVIGDMLVGELRDALLCGHLGGLACSRPFAVAVATVAVLFPLISFRTMGNLAFAGWTGVGALLLWALATAVLVAFAVAEGQTQPVRFLPNPSALGQTGFQVFTNGCAVISTLTTAYSCQAAGLYALKDLQPASPGKRGTVTLAAVIITTLMYLLISLGSYVVFGASVKADVLQNFSVHRLQSILPVWFSWVVSFVARLSFLLGVMTLYPLMMFPARDGLLRLFARRSEDLSAPIFYAVTYLISTAVFAVSIITPSIKGPIQVIGATAGAVIGFIVPGLLAFRRENLEDREEQLLEACPEGRLQWNFKSAIGWLLVVLGIVQCMSGIAAQVF